MEVLTRNLVGRRPLVRRLSKLQEWKLPELPGAVDQPPLLGVKEVPAELPRVRWALRNVREPVVLLRVLHPLEQDVKPLRSGQGPDAP